MGNGRSHRKKKRVEESGMPYNTPFPNDYDSDSEKVQECQQIRSSNHVQITNHACSSYMA